MGVYHDVTGHAACGTDEGDVGNALAHHPLEVVSQKTVDREDVIGSLMIGDKHITRLVVDVLAPHYLDPYQMHPAPHPCPPFGRKVAPIVLIKQAAYHRDDGCDDTVDQHNG